MDKTDKHEQVSALADGELQGDALARAVAATASDSEAREAWHAYHLIGESLRQGQPATGSDPQAFLARLQARLRDEPAPRAVLPALQAAPVARPAAANDGWWKLVAGVASVAAVAAISWNVMAPTAASQPQLAAAPTAPAVVPVATQVRPDQMIRDARLDQLLAAHRHLGGATALQNPSGFLRNATFEGAGR